MHSWALEQYITMTNLHITSLCHQLTYPKFWRITFQSASTLLLLVLLIIWRATVQDRTDPSSRMLWKLWWKKHVHTSICKCTCVMSSTVTRMWCFLSHVTPLTQPRFQSNLSEFFKSFNWKLKYKFTNRIGLQDKVAPVSLKFKPLFSCDVMN